MCDQVAWIFGYAPPLQVRRARAHHTPHSADLFCNESAVEKRADADRNIDAVFDQVQAAVRKLKAGVDTRVFLQDLSDDRQKIKLPNAIGADNSN